MAEQPEQAEQAIRKVRKTYRYKLKPTREQTRLLERTLMLCRHIYNAAMGERREAWRMRDLSVGYYQQTVELPGLKEALPEYGAVHSQVLQDVVLRVDCAFQAFFRRVQAGETETPGYRRFHGRDRFHRFTYPQAGEHGGAWLDNGFLVLSTIGRIAVRWSRPLEPTAGGHPQDGRPQPGSRWLVRLRLVRRGTDAAASPHRRTRDGH